jgi:tryptophanyl-tRNA synthetase
MSKSLNQYSTIYLNDDDESIRKKMRKAKTDTLPSTPGAPKSEAIQNLFDLMKLVSSDEVIAKFENDYNNLSIRYGDLKDQLADDIIIFIAPIREKANAILHDEKYLGEVMEKGAAGARKSAHATMDLVKKAMGLDYF